MNRLSNKIALVTGGAQGIGAAIVAAFHEEGATVIVADQLPTTKRQDLPFDLYHQMDVSSESDWEELTTIIQRKYGGLHLLVNNAGITGHELDDTPQDPEHLSLKTWKSIHDINLDSVFLGCKYLIPLLKKEGGSILNIGSRSGLVGVPQLAAYASSKAAIRNHTKTVALYCAEKGYNIRCNALHPAAIMTPLWHNLLGEETEAYIENKKNLDNSIPLGQMGNPKDVAYAAVYLSSDEAKFVTGTDLIIDGGILAGCAATPRPLEE